MHMYIGCSILLLTRLSIAEEINLVTSFPSASAGLRELQRQNQPGNARFLGFSLGELCSLVRGLLLSFNLTPKGFEILLYTTS